MQPLPAGSLKSDSTEQGSPAESLGHWDSVKNSLSFLSLEIWGLFVSIMFHQSTAANLYCQNNLITVMAHSNNDFLFMSYNPWWALDFALGPRIKEQASHTLLMLWQREPQRCCGTWCFLKLVPRSGSCHLHSHCLSQRIHCVAKLGINDVERIKLSLGCSSQGRAKRECSAYFDNNKL